MTRPKKPKTAREVATRIVSGYVGTRPGGIFGWQSWPDEVRLRDAIARALRKAERDATRGGGG